MAFAIAFLSAVLATDEITFKVVSISLMSALLIALIKFREFWIAEVLAEKNKTASVKIPSIFF